MFNFSGHLQELRSTIIGLALLLGATLIGCVWISIGLNYWLSAQLGSVWGPIVLGLLYFFPITIFAFIKAFVRQSKPLAAQNESVNLATANIAAALENLSGLSPFLVAVAAIIASFLATRFPALLSVFMQLLTAYADDLKKRAASAHSQPTDKGSTES